MTGTRSSAPTPRSATSVLFGVLAICLVLLCPGESHAQSTGPGERAEADSRAVVPAMGSAQVRRLRGVFRKGLERGNRSRSFIKVGDSISWTPLFLQGFSCGEERLGRQTHLRKTIRWYQGLRLASISSIANCPGGGDDPFGRDSTATRPYQFTGWPLNSPPTYPGGLVADLRCGPLEAPLACESRLLKPSIALVMLGTNDASVSVPPESVRNHLAEISEWLITGGTIPVLSTLPPRLDTPERGGSASAYNSEILQLGREQRVPVIDLYRAFTARGMVAQGMSDDGVHPSTLGVNNCWWQNPRCRSTDLRPSGLRFGHNRRNLLVLQTLERLRQRVIAPVLRSTR